MTHVLHRWYLILIDGRIKECETELTSVYLLKLSPERPLGFDVTVKSIHRAVSVHQNRQTDRSSRERSIIDASISKWKTSTKIGMAGQGCAELGGGGVRVWKKIENVPGRFGGRACSFSMTTSRIEMARKMATAPKGEIFHVSNFIHSLRFHVPSLSLSL